MSVAAAHQADMSAVSGEVTALAQKLKQRMGEGHLADVLAMASSSVEDAVLLQAHSGPPTAAHAETMAVRLQSWYKGCGFLVYFVVFFM